jgi:hypothetical protein
VGIWTAINEATLNAHCTDAEADGGLEAVERDWSLAGTPLARRGLAQAAHKLQDRDQIGASSRDQSGRWP